METIIFGDVWGCKLDGDIWPNQEIDDIGTFWLYLAVFEIKDSYLDVCGELVYKIKYLGGVPGLGDDAEIHHNWMTDE